MNLLPCPRSIKRGAGFFILPRPATLQIDSVLEASETQAVAKRLEPFGITLSHPGAKATILANQTKAVAQPEGYVLLIGRSGIRIQFGATAGLRAAIATLRQLLREYDRKLPFLRIRDWPDFPRRGVMLDISRGRVPKVETLLELVDHLADFKINEFQLYTEHTFAYRKYKRVWQSWGALTAREIRQLDARCRELGVDLVPNQNSFGHLREFLAYRPLKKLGEVAAPYESAPGEFLRFPSTLAPNHPGTLPFVRRLYNEVLPNFTSQYFNVGCDETWDLGRGQSRRACEQKGKGHVYLEFLKRIHREVSARKLRMMFWGDFILNHPELIGQLPKDAIALNWGYEASHPFEGEAALFARSRIPFYVCPGTSTWMTLIGKHNNALVNLRSAARAGRKHGALGYLITDWGDGGHPQPLAVSYLPYLAGAALSWCAESFEERKLVPVLSRDVFEDSTHNLASAALGLGLAHRTLGYSEPNVTPLGTVIAAPLPETRELFCRDGLNYYARISTPRIEAAWVEIEKQRKLMHRARPKSTSGKVLLEELDLAARMAAQSCQFMLWQKAIAAGKTSAAQKIASAGKRELQELDRDFVAYWPARNKATSQKCSPFLQWRMADYRKGFLPQPSRS
jgi:hexosaminidase